MSNTIDEAFACHQRGDFAGAERLYRAALAQAPRHAGVLHMLGLVHHQTGRHRSAADLIEAAIAIEPRQAAAHSNLALARLALGDAAGALAACDRAIALSPTHAEAHNNRGVALAMLGRDSDAVASFDAALALRPVYVDALENRGAALTRLGRFAAVAVNDERLLAIAPNRFETWIERGAALAALRRTTEALACFVSALALRPRQPDALAGKGNALYEMRRYDAAAQAFGDLLAVAPEFPYAAGTRVRCRQMGCDWSAEGEDVALLEAAVARGEPAVLPIPFLAMSASPALQLQCARAFVADTCPPAPLPLRPGRAYRHDRIRVAYLSTKFRDHAGAWLIAGLLEAHDKQRFETVGISCGPAPESAMRERIRRALDRFVDARERTDLEVARMMVAMEIDVAVDLTGHGADSRLGVLAHRPAPVQVSFLGYPGTLGADYVDYLIADRHVVPPGDEGFYAERIVRLPDTYQVNDDKRRIAELTPTREQAGLAEADFVFCCFNHVYKITPRVFALWMRLLQRVRGSVLWLLEDNPIASANLRREAERRGIGAQRLVFAPRVPHEAHLARHRLADLSLDTLPYAAHTTASDALWSGLPHVTCTGSTFAGRVAASLLHAVELPELVTRSLDEYESLASTLATEPERLAAVRERLARNRTTTALFDTDRFRRHIEAAYATMRERAQRGEPPAAFDVAPIA